MLFKIIQKCNVKCGNFTFTFISNLYFLFNVIFKVVNDNYEESTMLIDCCSA